jgi:hypothetical protein
MTRKRQRTLCYPAGGVPEALDAAPAYRRRDHQVFFTNDYDLDRMRAWCRRACTGPHGFYVKARVVDYPSGASLIQEEHLFAQFVGRSDAVAFQLRWG